MPARFEVRKGTRRKAATLPTAEPTHEWVALVGGNGQTMAVTETYAIGHGNADRAIDDIIAAVAEAAEFRYGQDVYEEVDDEHAQ